MKRKIEEFGPYKGVITNLDPTHVPVGGAVSGQNFTQYFLGRIQRTPGINSLPVIAVDGQYQIPLLVYAKELGGSGTATQLIGMYIGNTNQLTANQASVESGTTGFIIQGGATISQDCTTSQFGSCSLKAVVSTASDGWLTTVGTGGIPVVGGATYSFSVYVKGNSSGVNMQFGIGWYTSSGTLISFSPVTGFTSATSFTRQMTSGTAPSNAAFAAVFVIIQNSAAFTYWSDGLQFELNTAASTWTLPGAGTLAALVNLNTLQPLAGPSMVSTGQQAYSNLGYIFYAQQHLVALAGQPIQQITSASAFSAWPFTGTLTARPELIQSFLDRLYVVDNTNAEGLVQYSDVLSNNFQALNVVNTKEIPGPITALGIYVPSTGTMGIRSGLLIFKRNAIWIWDEASKDIISQKVGTKSPQTIKNTPAGVVLLGEKSNITSVFLIPPGFMGFGIYHFGEPIDIGKSLYNVLNQTAALTWFATTIGGTKMTWNSGALTWQTGGGLTQPILAHGEVDGKFYKLYFTLGAGQQNNTEYWLDLDILTMNPGETREGREPQAVWYGPMTRGPFDASAVGDDITGPITLSVRGLPNAKTTFQENTSLATSFIDYLGNTLQAFLDIPLNHEPREVKKQWGIVEIHIAPEAHVQGNQFSVQVVNDDTPVGVQQVFTMNETNNTIKHFNMTLFDSGRIGGSGHHPRIQLTHQLNQRFDILGFMTEFWIADTPKIVPDIR